MEMHRLRAAAALALALAAAACDGAPTTPAHPSTVRGDWGADPVAVTVPTPSGERRMNAVEAWYLYPDGTYHRQRVLVDQASGYPEYVQDGHYTVADGILEFVPTHAYSADYTRLSPVATMQPVSGITQRYQFSVAGGGASPRALSVVYICGPTENCVSPMPPFVLHELPMLF